MDPLRALLTVLGVVATVAGAYGALTGLGGMTGDSAGTVNVDSEYRFLSVLWLAYGVAVLAIAPRAHKRASLVRALMLVLFAAGVARGLSWVVEGRPDPPYLVLLGLELCFPLLVVAILRLMGRSPGSTPYA